MLLDLQNQAMKFLKVLTLIQKSNHIVVGCFETKVDAIKRIVLKNLNQLTSDNVIAKPIKKISSNAYFNKKTIQVDINKPTKVA